MNRHEQRMVEMVAHEAAQFIASEAGTQSLITVTRAELSGHGERISVFVSVFPEVQEKNALVFLERQRGAFSDHLKKNTRIKPLPRIDFMIDVGEKNRQHLDQLGRI